jgi:hypothetical protein
VYLETERVLQVVARLLVPQAGHHGGVLSYVYDLKVAGFGQRAGNLVHLLLTRHLVRLSAEIELDKRADVAEFTNANVAVVVRKPMHVRHRTRGLAEQRGRIRERAQHPSFQVPWHNLAPGRLVVRFGQAVGLVVGGDLVTVEQAGKHRSVSVLV